MMFWLICAIAVFILFGIIVFLCLKKKKSVSRSVIILSCLFFATFIGYMPPYYSSFGFFRGVVGNLVHTLRIITVDSDITEFYDVIYSGIQNDFLSQIYISFLGILHVALPAVSALTAVTVLLRCFSSLQLSFANRRNRPMFVFSEVNERSLCLAKSLKKIKCDIVFANDIDDSINYELKKSSGIITKEESITDLKIKSHKKKDIYFFCISEDEDVSLSYTLQIINRFADISEDEQEHIHIFQFSKSKDFSVFIDSANKGSLDIQCINEYEMLIYNLLHQYPLVKCQNSGIHILIHGLNELNIVALKAIAWCGQLCDYSLRISVVGIDINDKVDLLRLNTPGLFSERYNINFYNCKNEKDIFDTVSNNCSDVNYIIVSDESDNRTMELGVLLRRLFYKLNGEFNYAPPIFCYIKDPSKFELLKNLCTAESNIKRKVNYDLIPFGGLDEVFTHDNLIDSYLDKLAKNVHLAYEEIFSDGPINVKEALKRYKIFEVNKRSNRANALHIRYKLNTLGLDFTDSTDKEAVNISDYYTEESLESMSIAEHNRWMAFLETEGWIPSNREEVIAYRNSDLSRGRHNCPILKMHPYICEYEKLKDLSLELEGKDTTVYDKELILRIPDILNDKWNVSGKKYNIVKMN